MNTLLSLRRLVRVIALAASILVASGALATQRVWTGNGDSLWSHSGNWASGVPVNGDNLRFNASSHVFSNDNPLS